MATFSRSARKAHKRLQWDAGGSCSLSLGMLENKFRTKGLLTASGLYNREKIKSCSHRSFAMHRKQERARARFASGHHPGSLYLVLLSPPFQGLF